MSRKSVRSSHPINEILDILGTRWTLRILWELRDGPQSFRALQARCERVSPTVLNQRLALLREHGIVTLESPGGYRLTSQGRELGEILMALSRWAKRWSGDAD